MKKSTVLSMAALLAAPALLISGQAGAAETASHTKLTNCVIQEVVSGKDMTGAFVHFHHTGAPVKLVRAEVPDVSARVELHEMVMQNGVMEMFKKGADHVMLFDVTNKPKVGSKHTMTVFFDDGTQASCEAVVKSVKEVMKDAGIKHDGHGAHHGKHGDHHGKHGDHSHKAH
ncbi:MAG: copper chaperone PCu(A)C [Lautropia mirabilis]|nr:copper chaperone PCu(A)C [Lautropia mirabilis]